MFLDDENSMGIKPTPSDTKHGGQIHSPLLDVISPGNMEKDTSTIMYHKAILNKSFTAINNYIYFHGLSICIFECGGYLCHYLQYLKRLWRVQIHTRANCENVINNLALYNTRPPLPTLVTLYHRRAFVFQGAFNLLRNHQIYRQ